ncbi:MAG: SdpI family protein [archaeon]|jgi:uncharacterized membrane protein
MKSQTTRVSQAIQKKQAKQAKQATPGQRTINPNLVIIYLCILFAFFISAFSYNLLPPTMITHWGLNGEANGFSSKEMGLAIIPVLMTIIIAVLYYLPKLDPFRKNMESIQEEYQKFIAVFSGFMLYIQIIVILLNLGIPLQIGVLFSPAFAALFYSVGNLIGKAKRNYFIGIRTPWTLSSDTVWDKTHKLGEKLFKGTAILCIFGIILPNYFIILLLVPLIIGSIGLIIYSYKEYKKEQK